MLLLNNDNIYTLLSLGAILNFKVMTSFAERLQPPSLSFDSRDSTMSGKEAKLDHYESLYFILFLCNINKYQRIFFPD